MNIFSDYPGGNIIFKGIKQEHNCTVVYLEQDLRDTDRWWFYWNFRIDSPPVGKVKFSFCNKAVVCPYGAAESENGIDWQYNEDGYEDDSNFTYFFDTSEKSFYFAFTLPYQLSHFETFFKSISDDCAVERKILTVSEKGREIPLITFGNGKNDVVFTARHHCCESTASYALEGVINALLSENRSLLNNFCFHIIPFVDIDGAENGDQGKSRIPHDHNRDYTDKPIYAVTKAIMDYAKKLNICFFIDFHSPWKWGGADSRPHIHLSGFEKDSDETERQFIKTLKMITNHPNNKGIKYDGYITHWGDPVNPPDSESADNWFKRNCGAKFAATIETPYSGDLEHGYTPHLLRKWGEDISKTISEVF